MQYFREFNLTRLVNKTGNVESVQVSVTKRMKFKDTTKFEQI